MGKHTRAKTSNAREATKPYQAPSKIPPLQFETVPAPTHAHRIFNKDDALQKLKTARDVATEKTVLTQHTVKDITNINDIYDRMMEIFMKQYVHVEVIQEALASALAELQVIAEAKDVTYTMQAAETLITEPYWEVKDFITQEEMKTLSQSPKPIPLRHASSKSIADMFAYQYEEPVNAAENANPEQNSQPSAEPGLLTTIGENSDFTTSPALF